MNMTNLATERNKWHTHVNMSRKIRYYIWQDISWLSEGLLAFQRLCSMQYASSLGIYEYFGIMMALLIIS